MGGTDLAMVGRVLGKQLVEVAELSIIVRRKKILKGGEGCTPFIFPSPSFFIFIFPFPLLLLLEFVTIL